jgi:hypothetical protein
VGSSALSSPNIAVCAAPADYAELYLEYGPVIKRVVWRSLGPDALEADADDGVSYILQQFMLNDVISQYDAEHVSEFTGRPVTFKAFILNKVAAYCKGLRDKQARKHREVSIDAGGDEDSGSRWVDQLPGTWEDYPSLGDSEVLGRLRDRLAARGDRPGQPSLAAMFDAVAGRYAAGQTVTPAGVRGQLGLGREEALSLYAELRQALREITDPHRFDLGGLVLDAEQVRAAVTALKASTGNRVLPAFIDAGHPLAAAGKTWYLGFADQVMKEHPECRTPKGGHYPGGHFGRVKAALIYGLELMVGREPDIPVLVYDERMWTALEAVLCHMPGATPGKTALLLTMIQSVLAQDEAVEEAAVLVEDRPAHAHGQGSHRIRRLARKGAYPRRLAPAGSAAVRRRTARPQLVAGPGPVGRLGHAAVPALPGGCQRRVPGRP